MGKLIYFPLAIMILVSIFTIAMYSTNFGGGKVEQFGQGGRMVDPVTGELCIVDKTGHPVCYQNGTPYDEQGQLISGIGGGGYSGNAVLWQNGTAPNKHTYEIGERSEMEGFGGDPNSKPAGFFAFTDSYGFLAIVIAIMAVAMILTIKIFNSGTSDYGQDMFFKMTSYVTIWAVLSFISYAKITEIPTFGPYLYLGLSFVYTLGCVNSVGHPSGE